MKINEFASEVFTVNFVATLVSYGLLGMCLILSPSLYQYRGLIAIYSLTIIFSTIGVEWVYTIYEDFLYITVRSIAMQFMALILLFALVKEPDDLYIYAGLNVLAGVGGNVFNFFYSRRYVHYRIKLKKESFKHLKPSLIFFSSSIASTIYSNIDITMLGFIQGDYSVGIYSVAVKFYVTLKTLLTAITSVTVPRLTGMSMKGDIKEYNNLLTRIVKLIITALLPMVVGIIIVADDLVVVLCGEEYYLSGMCLKLLSFAIVMSIFASIVNGCILVPNKMEKFVLKSTMSGAVVNIVLNIPFIPLCGANGAAITTVLSEMTVLLVAWHSGRKYVELSKLSRTVWISSISSITMAIPALVLMSIVPNVAIIRLCVTMVSCIVWYVLLSMVLKNEVMIDFLKILLARVKK